MTRAPCSARYDAMLAALSIRNIVLIEALDLAFGPGLGVLTGETGAGKSILLDALGLVLGNRADTGLVRAGEVGGVLDETLDRLAHFLEADLRLRSKIKAAMTYPVLVLIVAFLIVTGLVVFIVPKFIEIFKDFNVQMPAPTAFFTFSFAPVRPAPTPALSGESP